MPPQCDTLAPTARPSVAALGPFDQPEKEQQDASADRGADDRGKPPRAKSRQAEHTPQPAADEGTDHADDEIADDAEAAALHDLAGEPAGDQADDQKYDQ